MTNKLRQKARWGRMLLVALYLPWGSGISHAVPIPVDTGNVDLRVLQPIPARLDAAKLVKWRASGGRTFPFPDSTGNMTFRYLQSGSGLQLPTRAVPGDNSANDMNDLWSDDALQVVFKKPNDIGSAILVYTDNANQGNLDPIGPISLRGGLVGGSGCNVNCLNSQTLPSCSSADQLVCAGRASVVPLLWKAVSIADLEAASNAIPATSPLFMPLEIESPSGGACPAYGPYPAGAVARASAGFCDYSTHYMLDKNNTDPSNLWWQHPNVVNKSGAYNYASLAGAFGVNASDAGVGGGGPGERPAGAAIAPDARLMHAVVGAKLSNSIRTQYRTTIYVEMVVFQ